MTSVTPQYEFTVIATDVVVFTIIDDQLHVLLIEMQKNPFTGYWAVPGGLVKPEESVDDAAKRHLSEKTGGMEVYLEQVHTFGAINRDPFGRVVSVAYFALIRHAGLQLETTESYNDIRWFPVDDLPQLAYDHEEVIQHAMQRLQQKLTTTNVAYNLLPERFTLSTLQKTYEIILKNPMDKRNFRKKILALNLVKKTSHVQAGGAHRPAALYTFTSRTPQDVMVL